MQWCKTREWSSREHTAVMVYSEAVAKRRPVTLRCTYQLHCNPC